MTFVKFEFHNYGTVTLKKCPKACLCPARDLRRTPDLLVGWEVDTPPHPTPFPTHLDAFQVSFSAPHFYEPIPKICFTARTRIDRS